jgi:hypothetical protein
VKLALGDCGFWQLFWKSRLSMQGSKWMSFAKFLLVSLGISMTTFSVLSFGTRMAELELAAAGVVLGFSMLVLAGRMR